MTGTDRGRSERSGDDDRHAVGSISTHRRKMLTLLGTSALTGLAGCSTVLDRIQERTGTPTSAEPRSKPPATGSTISPIRKQHANYLQGDEFTADLIDFQYDPVKLRDEGEPRFVAAPLSEGRGDRGLLSTGGESSEESIQIATRLLATFGAPVEERYDTVTVFGRDVSFRGGRGVGTLAAAGVTDLQDIGSVVLFARGTTPNALRKAMKSIDDLEL